MKQQYGYSEGDRCCRPCDGVIELSPVESCSCHINAPCSQCTSPRLYCPTCDWREQDDQVINDYRVSIDQNSGVFRCWEPRQLDKSKIDFYSKPHTGSSMLKSGVYPEHATIEDVEREVKGTFGGRFNYFGSGRFEYIAYTD